jgi:5S rRNA maturation endonuclease (ribonuclease M5)
VAEFDFDYNAFDVTKELLMSRHSQEKYMEHYLGVHVGRGLFKSPLRSDRRPTCAFYKNKHGDLIMKDFGSTFSGNFINVVMAKFDVSYQKALRIIANDFGIIKDPEIKINPPKIEYSGNVLDEHEQSKIQIEAKDFSEKELKWWGSFGITQETLKKFKIYSCKHVFLNGNLFTSSTENIPVFGYYGGKKDGIEHWRIYMPTKRNFRFISNWTKYMIQGAHTLPDSGEVLVITKSLKDVACFYELGIPAIAPCSETIFLHDNQLQALKKKFKHIIVFFDNDIAGVSNMRKIKKKYPELSYYFIPRKYEVKDLSDAVKRYGLETVRNFLNEQLCLGMVDIAKLKVIDMS